MKKRIVGLLGIILIFLPFSNHTFDNAHFYRATYFQGEPRFEKDALTSFDISLAGGTTRKGVTQCGREKKILDIYGTHNMHNLGKNVPSSNPTVDSILQNLNAIKTYGPHDACFAQLSYNGKFHIIEAYINIYQNLINGLFFQFNIPIRSLTINNICFSDLSPSEWGGVHVNKQTAEWQAFLNNFDTILSAYSLKSSSCINKAGLGDASIVLGWTLNYEKTTHLDFIDFTFAAGILFPTGKQKDQDLLFDLPLGYDGHFGAPLCLNFSLGYFDWITLGAYGQALVFVNRNNMIRMKTACEQSGLIKLAKGCAYIDKGTLWNMGGYVKADHLVKGFSFLFGYTYSKKNRDFIEPSASVTFLTSEANNDPTLNGWRMHTVHWIFEYDFTQKGMLLGPRVLFLINKQLDHGKQIFKTKMFGMDFGLDISWEF